MTIWFDECLRCCCCASAAAMATSTFYADIMKIIFILIGKWEYATIGGAGNDGEMATPMLSTPDTETTEDENWLYFLSTFNAMRRACMVLRFVYASRRFDYHIQDKDKKTLAKTDEIFILSAIFRPFWANQIEEAEKKTNRRTATRREMYEILKRNSV